MLRTRRQLLRDAGLLSLATAGRPLLAMAPPVPSGLRIGYASITWGGKDDLAIEDIAACGYSGIQIRTDALKIFPDPKQVKSALAAHHLTFVAFSSGSPDLDNAQASIDLHVEHAKYVRDAGGKYLQLVGSSSAKHPTWTADDYKRQGELLSTIGQRISELGLKLGFHNHMNTIGQAPEATDAILAASDPRYLFLELDIAHYLQGGGDPVAAVRKYSKRLLFLHFKDVKSAETKSGYQWVELGQGRVDIPGVLQALHDVHFEGWAIVELDSTTRTPKESALMSKAYLEKLGVKV